MNQVDAAIPTQESPMKVTTIHPVDSGNLKIDALNYHEFPTPGKLSIEVSKPAATQRDLVLAYSPGVAEPVRAIADNPENAYRYTIKGNLVAVISNGTAILGL